MGGSSEAIDCPRCGGKETLESSIDRTDVSGCCLECGYSYHTAHEMMTLEEVNTERGEFNLEPLTELKPCVGNWIDVPDPVVPVTEHQYDCKGNHRVVVDGEPGEASLYDSPAFVAKDGRWYMSVTQYYEGNIPHEMCEGVYELIPVNKRDASMSTAYNLFRPEEVCPHLDNVDVVCPGLTEDKCPQRKKEDAKDTDKNTGKDED